MITSTSYQKPPSFDKQVNPNTRLLDLIKNESLIQRLPQTLCEGLALDETSIYTHLAAVVEAEQAVLGGILFDSPALERVLELLKDYEFSVKPHQMIYDGCVRLYRQGQAANLMSLTLELSSVGQLERVGGQAGLADLVERTVSAINIDQFAQLLIEKSQKNPINKDGSIKLWAIQEIVGAIIRDKSEEQAELLLEDVRQLAGMAVSRWSKFIAPTVRKAKKQRYRQELKRILVIDDPLDQSDEIHEICQIYRVSEKKIQKDLAVMERQTYTKEKKRN